MWGLYPSGRELFVMFVVPLLVVFGMGYGCARIVDYLPSVKVEVVR